MNYKCLCGKEYQDIRAFNGHKIYCIPAGGKSYWDIVSGESADRWKAGQIRAVQANAVKIRPSTHKCEGTNCINLVKDNRQKYCSRRCWGVSLTGTFRKPKQDCLFCGKSDRKKFCNQRCQRDYTWKLAYEQWLSGENNLSSDCAKRALIQLSGPSCQECNWSGKNIRTGNVTTQIHHIDGDRTNSTRSNVKLLCPNCHSMTSTFGALNIKK